MIAFSVCSTWLLSTSGTPQSTNRSFRLRNGLKTPLSLLLTFLDPLQLPCLPTSSHHAGNVADTAYCLDTAFSPHTASGRSSPSTAPRPATYLLTSYSIRLHPCQITHPPSAFLAASNNTVTISFPPATPVGKRRLCYSALGNSEDGEDGEEDWFINTTYNACT